MAYVAQCFSIGVRREVILEKIEDIFSDKLVKECAQEKGVTPLLINVDDTPGHYKLIFACIHNLGMLNMEITALSQYPSFYIVKIII